jgi:pimeloyl-ACP methyl ester carboxylesterase
MATEQQDTAGISSSRTHTLPAPGTRQPLHHRDRPVPPVSPSAGRPPCCSSAMRSCRSHGCARSDHAPAYGGPTVVVAGRLDSTVGYAAATDLVDHYPHASLAVLDDAGHALPHEQPDLLRALFAEWLARVERSS